jgi:hypothetical protein
LDGRKIFLQEDVRSCVPVRLLNGRKKQIEKQAEVARRRKKNEGSGPQLEILDTGYCVLL